MQSEGIDIVDGGQGVGKLQFTKKTTGKMLFILRMILERVIFQRTSWRRISGSMLTPAGKGNGQARKVTIQECKGILLNTQRCPRRRLLVSDRGAAPFLLQHQTSLNSSGKCTIFAWGTYSHFHSTSVNEWLHISFDSGGKDFLSLFFYFRNFHSFSVRSRPFKLGQKLYEFFFFFVRVTCF